MFLTTVDRYILRYFFKAFMVLAIGFLGVIFAGLFIDQFSRVADLPLGKGLGFLLMQIPQFIQPLLPLSILIATMMTFWILIRQSELIPMRSTGQSVWRLFRPLAFATIALGMLFVTIINPITVALNKHVQSLGFEYGLSSQKPFEFSEGGFWLKEKGKKDTMILFAKTVQQKEKDLNLYDVTLFLTSFDHMFKSQIQVEHAVLQNKQFVFKGLKVFSPGEKIKTIEKKTRPTTFSLNKIQETLSENDLISFWELPALIHFLDKAGMSTRRQITLLASLLFFPFLLSVFSLLGVAFSISKHVRHTKFFIRVALGIVAGFVFFFVDKVTLAMTHMGTLPIGLGIIGTSLIVLFLTTSFLLHKEDS